MATMKPDPNCWTCTKYPEVSCWECLGRLAQKRSLKKARNKEAATELLAKMLKHKLMYGHGKNGGWRTYAEYEIFERTLEKKEKDLYRLAQKAGGWWRWKDRRQKNGKEGGAGIVFVPAEKWLTLMDAWVKDQKALKEHLRCYKRFERLVKVT